MQSESHYCMDVSSSCSTCFVHNNLLGIFTSVWLVFRFPYSLRLILYSYFIFSAIRRINVDVLINIYSSHLSIMEIIWVLIHPSLATIFAFVFYYYCYYYYVMNVQDVSDWLEKEADNSDKVLRVESNGLRVVRMDWSQHITESLRLGGHFVCHMWTW